MQTSNDYVSSFVLSVKRHKMIYFMFDALGFSQTLRMLIDYKKLSLIAICKPSRSAKFCRLLRRRIIITLPADLTRGNCLIVHGGIRFCAPKSNVFGTTTIRFTGFERPGVS